MRGVRASRGEAHLLRRRVPGRRALRDPPLLVVSLAGDSYFAPDRTLAVPFQGVPCATGTCAQLPGVAVVRGAYTVSPHVQKDILQYSLNLQNALTTLPVHASYRPLWPQTALSESADAIAAGLPLEPVEAASMTNVDYLDSNVAGPAAGPSQMFATYVQPGNYERTLTPLPPLDGVFPPEVRIVNVPMVSAGSENLSFEDDPMNVDSTTQTNAGRVTPAFNISRSDMRPLDGWSAFLRDQTTKQTVSNVAALSGTFASNVVLATNRFPPDGDSLTDTELVLSPPAGQAMPTAVFAPQGRMLSADEIYPVLPKATNIQGIVSAGNGTPVEADVVFEAIGIATARANPTGVATAICPLNATNFEYVARVSARFDSTGNSAFSVELPVGAYRVSIRPVDAPPPAPGALAPEPAFGVTIMSPFVVPCGSPEPACSPCTVPSDPTLLVTSTRPIQGFAKVADGRFLTGAVVDAIPISCTDGSSSAACLPRARQAATDDGAFRLWLDAGASYRLRVRPADGSRLPWTWQPVPLVVKPGVIGPIQFLVHAPVYAGLTLSDPGQDPIVNAVVRIYTPSDSAMGWLEIGRAITDATGHYDLYLPPP